MQRYYENFVAAKSFPANYGNFSIFNLLAVVARKYVAIMDSLPAKMTFGGQT
jgi:hypothetical protein